MNNLKEFQLDIYLESIYLLWKCVYYRAGAVIVFLGSDLLHQSLRNDDNNGLVGRMDEGLNDFQMFVNDSLKVCILFVVKQSVLERYFTKLALKNVRHFADVRGHLCITSFKFTYLNET